VTANSPERSYVFGCSFDDVVDRVTLSATASDRTLTVDNRNITFHWSSDQP
jgi:hypothetical protein